jgi:predicted nucleic acid-binding protein
LKKIYLDTSVISAYFDFKKPLRQIITEHWFQKDLINYEYYISTLVLEEIDNNSNNILKSKMLSLISDYNFNLLEINDDIFSLSSKYRSEILKKENNDSIHIATASFYGLDSIVSWNFKHIVNLETMSVIHKINLKNNFGIIEILSPQNLGGNKYGNL